MALKPAAAASDGGFGHVVRDWRGCHFQRGTPQGPYTPESCLHHKTMFYPKALALRKPIVECFSLLLAFSPFLSLSRSLEEYFHLLTHQLLMHQNSKFFFFFLNHRITKMDLKVLY